MKFSPYKSLATLLLVLGLVAGCDEKEEPVVEEPPFELPSKVIHKIIIDDNGVKWFATDKGVVSFDGYKWSTYSDDKNLSTGSISDIIFDGITSIQKLWLGSLVGLSSYEIGKGTLAFLNYNTGNSGILNDTVTALGVDAGNVKYVGTSAGLSILKDGSWNKYFGRKGEEILRDNKISSIGTARNGYIYAATEGGGISRFKYADAISGETTFKQPWAWGLPSDTVFTVFTDGVAQWFGTLRGATYHSSEITKLDWTSYSRLDGLICDSVYAIAKDHAGDIWFGTHKGVSKIALSKDSTWTSFTTKDGLIANKINTIATDKDGSLWFGTDEGISQYSNNKWTKY